jgi:hypothetical protein
MEVSFDRSCSYSIRYWVISEQNLNQNYNAEENSRNFFKRLTFVFTLTKYKIVSAGQCKTLTKGITNTISELK